jgi:pimeloyl-ACP methyl ester carboxylesterase
MTEITHRTIKTNGINLHLAEAGNGPLVLLVHGWPESWYSWRHQLKALADAGYHAVAPDVRGYGGSDKPEPIEAYSMKEVAADLIGVLDELGEKQAVIVGHDWGSMIAWQSALMYPDRYRAVVGMSVPFMPRPPLPVTQLLKAAFGENWFYILYFQEPGKAEAEFEADVDRTMRTLLGSQPGADGEAFVPAPKPKDAKFFDNAPPPPKTLPSWLSEEDLAYFVGEFKRAGFRGGLNKYRNMDRDWEESAHLQGEKIKQPALFITGDKDPVLAFSTQEGMKTEVPLLKEIVTLPGGHWIQQERANEVNEALISFLKGL